MISTSTQDAFLASRATGIGSSDIAALMGKDPYRDALQVYWEKRGESTPAPLNGHMRRGIALEPIVADIVSEMLDTPLALPPVAGVRHPFHRHVLCHPDRVTDDTVIEIKCPSRWAFAKIQKDNAPPWHYVLQQQYCMGILGLPHGVLAIHCADTWETLLFELDADATLQQQMYETAEQFWMKHVDCGVPPTDSEVVVPVSPTTDDVLPLEGALLGRVQRYAQVKEDLEVLSAELDLLRGELMGAAQTPGRWAGNGFRFSYTMVPGRKSISKSRLQEAGLNPEDYMVAGKPYPRFDVVKQEELS